MMEEADLEIRRWFIPHVLTLERPPLGHARMSWVGKSERGGRGEVRLEKGKVFIDQWGAGRGGWGGREQCWVMRMKEKKEEEAWEKMKKRKKYKKKEKDDMEERKKEDTIAEWKRKKKRQKKRRRRHQEMNMGKWGGGWEEGWERKGGEDLKMLLVTFDPSHAATCLDCWGERISLEIRGFFFN